MMGNYGNGWGMMGPWGSYGWGMMGNTGLSFGFVLSLLTWLLFIAVLVALLRWLWKKGNK